MGPKDLTAMLKEI